MKGVSVSHFKSGGVIGDIIKKAQDSTAILMQDTAGLIDDAAKIKSLVQAHGPRLLSCKDRNGWTPLTKVWII